MYNLPLRAFIINGYDEYIELTIEEVFGYPEETSYGGGYGAKGIVKIRAGNYQVTAPHYFTTGELFEFKEELKSCYKNVTGKAELKNVDREMELQLSIDYKGHVIIEGSFQERMSKNNILTYEIECDQSCLVQAIKDLEDVEKHFGGMEGKRTK